MNFVTMYDPSTFTANKNEDNTMKYKTKVHFEQIPAGVEIEAEDSVYGDNLIYKFTEDKWVANETFLEQHPDWFEPVEQVQEGQYWKLRGDIIRVNRVYSRASCKAIEGKVIDISEKSYDWTVNKFTEEARKLSTDEIEQALIKEAKRRGYTADNFKCLFLDTQEDNEYYFQYELSFDWLFIGDNVVYKEGQWAEILDQTPTIEINGYEVELNKNKASEPSDDMVKIGCKDVYNTVFIDLNRYANKFDLSIVRNGEDITDQIKQIAEYYQTNKDDE